MPSLRRSYKSRARQMVPNERPFGERRSSEEPLSLELQRAQEHDRGRYATQPLQIPRKGWYDILWRTYQEMQQDRLLSIAGGVSFFVLLAIFPAITALVSAYGLFFNPARIANDIGQLRDLVPANVLTIVHEQATRIASNNNQTLSLGLVLLLAMAAIVVLPLVLSPIGFGNLTETIARIARWPLLLIVLLFGLAILYRYCPDRRAARWQWVSVGSGFATLTWFVASFLFSWYLASFANYNATYGSLGAAVGLMIWFWISTIVVLLGAELNAEIEHQTARDSTVGADKPLGQRGAVMADTVGAKQA
jgi:membrane protein